MEKDKELNVASKDRYICMKIQNSDNVAHCNTLQVTTVHCNKLKYTTTHFNMHVQKYKTNQDTM